MPVLAQNLLTSDDSPPALAGARAEGGELAAEALAISGRLRLRVRGESMIPALWPGEEVEITACALHDLQSGDIALAQRGGRFFLHRFLARRPDGTFLLRGDSIPRPDAPFASRELLGRMARRPGRIQAAICRCIGVALCAFEPARRLALRLHRQGAAARRNLQSLKSF